MSSVFGCSINSKLLRLIEYFPRALNKFIFVSRYFQLCFPSKLQRHFAALDALVSRKLFICFVGRLENWGNDCLFVKPRIIKMARRCWGTRGSNEPPAVGNEHERRVNLSFSVQGIDNNRKPVN